MITNKYFSIVYFSIFFCASDRYMYLSHFSLFVYFFVESLKLKRWTPNGDTNCASSLLDIKKRPWSRRDERSQKAMALIGSFLHLQKGICRGQNCRSPVANRRVTLFDRSSTCRDGASLKISERAARKWAEGFQRRPFRVCSRNGVTPTQQNPLFFTSVIPKFEQQAAALLFEIPAEFKHLITKYNRMKSKLNNFSSHFVFINISFISK